MKIESESNVLFSTISAQPASQNSTNCSQDVIEINGLYAAKQGFKNGQVVGLHFIHLYTLFFLFLLATLHG